MSALRFGLIGLGRHGSRYARHLSAGDIAGASLTKVWRRDAAQGRAQATTFGASWAENIEELCRAPDVDAVIIAVPAGQHESLALAVAAANKPLLIEKPLAVSRAGAASIAEAFDARGLPLMVAQTLRFDPMLAAMNAALDRIGTLTGFAFEQRLEPRGLGWEDDPALAGGGVLLQTAVHTIDALLWLTAPATVKLRASELRSVHYKRLEDHAALVLELEGSPRAAGRSIVGTIGVSKIGRSRHMRFSLYGEDGGIEADFLERSLMTMIGKERLTKSVPERPTVEAALSAFTAHLREKKPNPVSSASARRALDVIFDAYDQRSGGSTLTSLPASS